MAMATPQWFHPGLKGALDKALDSLVVFTRDEWTNASRLLTWVTNRHLDRSGAELFLKLLSNFCINEQTCTGQTDLARVHVLYCRGLRRRVEISVGTDDIGRFAAQLETDGRE